MISLRKRAVAGGIIWAILSVSVGAFGLAFFLNTEIERRFNATLRDRYVLAATVVANNHDNPENIAAAIGGPAYMKPLSGEYWQVENNAGGVFVSRSLGDYRLPQIFIAGGAVIQSYAGPDGTTVRAIQSTVYSDDGVIWYVHVASSTASIAADRQALRNNLIAAFGLVAFIGIAGAILQASATLQPLSKLRSDVLARWDTQRGLDRSAYPVEVVPLVDDINSLLERNRVIVESSRRQAADLAHAIKTPSAIIRNELEKLKTAGQPADPALDALDRLDAQLKRSFARMRGDADQAAVHAFTDLDKSLGRIARAFTTMAAKQDKTLEARIKGGLRIRMDQSDFEEIIGNMLDNALKWCVTEIRISASQSDEKTLIVIEDDGPGISQADAVKAMEGGQRLDVSKPGTGLGLAISADLCRAYGGELRLDRSTNLGGLRVTISMLRLWN